MAAVRICANVSNDLKQLENVDWTPCSNLSTSRALSLVLCRWGHAVQQPMQTQQVRIRRCLLLLEGISSCLYTHSFLSVEAPMHVSLWRRVYKTQTVATQSKQVRLRSAFAVSAFTYDRLRPFSHHRPSSNYHSSRNSSRCRLFSNHRAAGELARKHLRIRGPDTTDSFAYPGVSTPKGRFCAFGSCLYVLSCASEHSVCTLQQALAVGLPDWRERSFCEPTHECYFLRGAGSCFFVEQINCWCQADEQTKMLRFFSPSK